MERMMNGSPSQRDECVDVSTLHDIAAAFGRHGVLIANGMTDEQIEHLERFGVLPSGSVGSVTIRVGGREIPVFAEDALEGVEEEWTTGDTWSESEVDPVAYAALRPGYKGGNVHNWMRDSNPCSKVNYDKVAKRRAKNKQARKNRHK